MNLSVSHRLIIIICINYLHQPEKSQYFVRPHPSIVKCLQGMLPMAVICCFHYNRLVLLILPWSDFVLRRKGIYKRQSWVPPKCLKPKKALSFQGKILSSCSHIEITVQTILGGDQLFYNARMMWVVQKEKRSTHRSSQCTMKML